MTEEFFQFQKIKKNKVEKTEDEENLCKNEIRVCEHNECDDCGDFPGEIGHPVYTCGHVQHFLFREKTFFCSKECKMRKLVLKFV